ncbi:DMT family transporter [Paraburkholderia ginsengiterrae]|uniref:DMT family transporter n=1 Tax=Paraburkholderia ginsengiterrae TaxID=1462993 RepID=UPI000A5B463D|nr:EamA family transporter [Paraburkholderia ginsengiterrae]
MTHPTIARIEQRASANLLLTAIAPAIWGSTYIVTTTLLPGFFPVTVAMLRALPAGLLLLLIVRQLPTGIWWLRVFVLGALNIAFFLSMLFVAAYRLPGGVAATVAAVQPLIAVFVAAFLIGSAVRALSIVAALVGMGGVALLVMTPHAALDGVGVAAGLAGAVSMAVGNVLTRKWQPPVSLLTFTAWQLSAGGLLLVPVALVFEPAFPVPTAANLLGLAWLGLIGAALTYALWFRGIARLESSVVSSLLFLSPLTAVLLGWVFLNQALSLPQICGVAFIVGSIWLGQRANRSSAAPSKPTRDHAHATCPPCSTSARHPRRLAGVREDGRETRRLDAGRHDVQEHARL